MKLLQRLRLSAKYRSARLCEAVLVRLIQWLPPVLRVRIRERTRVTGPLDYARTPLRLHLESVLEAEVRVKSCAREPDLVHWIETSLRAGDTVYDIGANIGAYSLVMAVQPAQPVKVICFEPGYANFHHLCQNIVLNGVGDRVVPFQVALGDHEGTVTFNYHSLETGGSLHVAGEAIDHLGRPFDPVFRQQVLCYRLDEFVRFFQLPPPNHLKLDVDGNELAILKGAAGLLASPALRSVIIEVEEIPGGADLLRAELERAGLVLTAKHKLHETTSGDFAKTYNYLFTRGPAGAPPPAPTTAGTGA